MPLSAGNGGDRAQSSIMVLPRIWYCAEFRMPTMCSFVLLCLILVFNPTRYAVSVSARVLESELRSRSSVHTSLEGRKSVCFNLVHTTTCIREGIWTLCRTRMRRIHSGRSARGTRSLTWPGPPRVVRVCHSPQDGLWSSPAGLCSHRGGFSLPAHFETMSRRRAKRAGLPSGGGRFTICPERREKSASLCILVPAFALSFQP